MDSYKLGAKTRKEVDSNTDDIVEVELNFTNQ